MNAGAAEVTSYVLRLSADVASARHGDLVVAQRKDGKVNHRLWALAVIVAASAVPAAASATAGYGTARGQPLVAAPAWAPSGERIAYWRGSDQVETVRADGRDRQIVARAGDEVYDFTWSPDGTRLAIASYLPGEGAGSRIGIISARGGAGRTVLADPRYGSNLSASWAPRGERIVAVGHRLWIVAATGTFRWKVDREVWTAAWSPDGSRLAYTWLDPFPDPSSGRVYGESPIEIVNRDGDTVATLQPEDDALWVTGLSWSPDGGSLAYSTMPSNAWDSDHPQTWGPPIVHVASLAQPGTARVAFEIPGNAASWSRHGVIAYATGFRNPAEAAEPTAIQLARPDGTLLRRIDNATAPQWSPDGTHLLFERNGAVYVSGATGAQQRRIAVGRQPSWAPDGRRIAFVRARCGAGGGLFVASLAGSSRRIAPPGC